MAGGTWASSHSAGWHNQMKFTMRGLRIFGFISAGLCFGLGVATCLSGKLPLTLAGLWAGACAIFILTRMRKVERTEKRLQEQKTQVGFWLDQMIECSLNAAQPGADVEQLDAQYRLARDRAHKELVALSKIH